MATWISANLGDISSFVSLGRKMRFPCVSPLVYFAGAGPTLTAAACDDTPRLTCHLNLTHCGEH
jgi:hypothetical protein